jgi:hypothetical protein
LAQAVQAVSSEYIPDGKGSPGDCDLVAAINPSLTDLQNVWKILISGGSFYSEWYSPLAGGAMGIRKRLEAAGFKDVVCYWPWPISTFSPALFWLPLEAPQVIHYFLSSRPLPATLLRRFGSRVMQILWRILRNTNLLVPICVTARKADKIVGNVSTTDPEVHTFMNWYDETSSGSPTRFDILMWTGGKRSINKVILYQFAVGAEKPQRIIKLPRTTDAVPALTHEAHILQALHARKSNAATGIPVVLFLHEFSDCCLRGDCSFWSTVVYSPEYTECPNIGNQGDRVVGKPSGGWTACSPLGLVEPAG